MSSRAEILGTLQEIRDQMRSLTPSYETDFEEFALADTVRDWDYAAEPVFTSTELLELETIYQRLHLRWVERSNTLKERMMAQMVQEYLEVIRKAERRHRRLQQEEAVMNDETADGEDDSFGSPKDDEPPLEDETPEDAWEPDAVPTQQPSRARPDPVSEPTQPAVQTAKPTPNTTEPTDSSDGTRNANRTGRNRPNRA